MAEQQEKPRTVVIAMDGSEYSKYAFDWYVKNMHRPDDHVVMVHSVEYHDVIQNTQWIFGPTSIDETTLSNILEEQSQSLRRDLEHYAEIMKNAKIRGTVKSVHASRPGEGVVKAADECNATVIITGSRGKGKLRRTFIGSTSDYIMHHAHMPVIVCRNKEHHHHHHFHLFGHHHHHHDKEHHGSDERLNGKHHNNKHHDNKHHDNKHHDNKHSGSNGTGHVSK